MPRKILFYTHAFGGGGAEIVFSRLARAFAGAGDLVIFAADYQGPSPVTDQGNLRHVLLGPSHAASIRRLSALLRQEKPDASFSALGAQNLKHLIAAILAGRRGRCVLGYHGFADAERKLMSRLSFRMTPVLTRLAARTVCASDSLLANIRDEWGASAARTRRIHNPLPEFPSEIWQAPASHGAPLIIACGRLVAGKRFLDLVASFPLVKPPTTRLAILGEGPERAAIKSAIARAGLEDRVDMPGYVEDVSNWYRRAACLAISSESESFGLTAAEAFAHGLPVVSTDCGGPVEILAQGHYGRIVPIGDVQALAEALTETLASPGDASARRERARAFAIEPIHAAYAELVDALP